MIDTHTHIYLPEFDEDRAAMLQRAKEKGVQYLLLPNIEKGTFPWMLDTTKEANGFCKAMVGLHPCSVKENASEELEFVKKELFETRSLEYFGVGEIGLDYYWDLTFVEQQKQALKQQLLWAAELDLPVSIHSRNATQDSIDIVKEIKGSRGVFHCFSGSLNEANQIIELGYYMGIGGVVTFKKAGLDILLKDIPLQHIVLETDAPYLAPVPFRGKRNEPAYLEFVVNKLSEIYSLTIDEVKRITTENAIKIFKL